MDLHIHDFARESLRRPVNTDRAPLRVQATGGGDRPLCFLPSRPTSGMQVCM